MTKVKISEQNVEWNLSESRHGVKAAKRFIKDAEAEAEKKENRKLFRPVLCKELIRDRLLPVDLIF